MVLEFLEGEEEAEAEALMVVAVKKVGLWGEFLEVNERPKG